MSDIDSQFLLWGGTVDPGFEFYTPAYAVRPLVKHLKIFELKQDKKITIWCPMDVREDQEFEDGVMPASNYYLELKKHFRVITSHILTGQDFFEYEPRRYDVIISNPPFKEKSKYVARALELGKPFLFLLPLTSLNDKYPAFKFFEANKRMQLQKVDM